MSSERRVRFAVPEEEEEPRQRRRRPPPPPEEDEVITGTHQMEDVDLEDDDDERKAMTGPVLGEERTAEEGLEAFNLKDERARGYFDTEGNFVWRNQGAEPDAWLAQMDEASMEAAIGSVRRREPEKKDEKIIDVRRLEDLMQSRESLADALRRLGKGLPSTKSDFDELTSIADALLSSGQVDCYDQIRENLLPEDTRLWVYKGLADGKIHGPFPTAQIREWQAHGFFTGSSAVPMRLHTSSSSSEEQKYDAHTDLLDDLDDDDDVPIAKRQRLNDDDNWQLSDDIDFSLPFVPLVIPEVVAPAPSLDDDDDDDDVLNLRRHRLPGGLQAHESDDDDD